MPRNIGFVGVGNMGSRMAGHLLDEGEEVVVYDVDSDRVSEMEERGAQSADSIEGIGDQTDVIFTSLPTNEVVRAVYLEDGGLVEHTSRGTILIETSTIVPAVMTEIERHIDARTDGARLVGCPVIGTPVHAEGGILTAAVGASTEDFEAVRPLIEPFASDIFHVGPVGRAKAVKLFNNAIMYGNFAVAAEISAVAAKHGIQQEDLFEITGSGAARSEIVDLKFPKVRDQDFEAEFPLRGSLKDLSYALEFAWEGGDRPSLLELTRERFEYATSVTDPEADYAILMSALTADE